MSNGKYIDKETLKYLIENNIIDLQQIRVMVEMKKNRELLDQHPYAIYEGKNGKYYTYLPDKERGRIRRQRNTKQEIEQVIIEYQRQKIDNPTIQEVFEEWNNYRVEIQDISQATHLRNTQIFNRHYGEIRNRKIKSITPEELEEFLERQIPKYNLTAKGFNNLKTVTRGFFKRAKKKKLIDFNIEYVFSELDFSDRKFKRIVKEDYEEVFDEAETDLVMEYLCQNLDLRNLGILLMFVTGIRVGELVALKHTDFEENCLKIRRTEIRYQKEKGKNIYEVRESPKTDAGVRSVAIPPDFAWIPKRLRMINPFGEYIFMENGKRFTTNIIRRRLSRICKTLNIYPKSPHKIRKTYGTILLDSGMDIRFITDQMGHSDILCTEVHYHRNRKTAEKKVEMLGGIKEFQIRAVK